MVSRSRVDGSTDTKWGYLPLLKDGFVLDVADKEIPRIYIAPSRSWVTPNSVDGLGLRIVSGYCYAVRVVMGRGNHRCKDGRGHATDVELPSNDHVYRWSSTEIPISEGGAARQRYCVTQKTVMLAYSNDEFRKNIGLFGHVQGLLRKAGGHLGILSQSARLGGAILQRAGLQVQFADRLVDVSVDKASCIGEVLRRTRLLLSGGNHFFGIVSGFDDKNNSHNSSSGDHGSKEDNYSREQDHHPLRLTEKVQNTDKSRWHGWLLLFGGWVVMLIWVVETLSIGFFFWAGWWWRLGILFLSLFLFALSVWLFFHAVSVLRNEEIVPQKHLDTAQLLGYSNSRGLDMANVLNTDKKIAVIASLAEGSSIRSVERITGVHRDTIMRLGVKVGQGCTAMMDQTMRNLPCDRLELDEIWGFVGKKDRQVRRGDPMEVGSVWTWCAIDADTKLVPAFRVGDRSAAMATAFVQDVADRMAKRVQISTDGLSAYREAIEKAFGADVDFAQIIKTYGHEETSDNRRYSAPEFVSSEKKIVTGRPNVDLISTSYVERLNATTRLHMRRLTRLTLAFSKKLENFEAAVGLHFAYYNFVKRHNTLRMTPAMAAGVAPTFWSVGDLLEATA